MEKQIGISIKAGITSMGMNTIMGLSLIDMKSEFSSRRTKEFKERRFKNKKFKEKK